jgi:endonuclease IV
MPLGFHVSKDGATMPAAIKRDRKWANDFNVEIGAAQIFVMGPQSRKETLTESDKVMIRSIVDEGFKLVTHSAYVNHPWKGGVGLDGVITEMGVSHKLGAEGLVVHLSKYVRGEHKELYWNLKSTIKKLNSDLPESVRETQTLFLEINAAKPTPYTFESSERLVELFNVVKDCAPRFKVGLCFDTAHLSSCGNTLDTYDKAKMWLDALPRDIPIIQHLNDSATPTGSGKDVHAPLLTGTCWGEYNLHKIGMKDPADSGLTAILDWATTNDTITILERNKEGLVEDFHTLVELGYYTLD